MNVYIRHEIDFHPIIGRQKVIFGQFGATEFFAQWLVCLAVNQLHVVILAAIALLKIKHHELHSNFGTLCVNQQNKSG